MSDEDSQAQVSENGSYLRDFIPPDERANEIGSESGADLHADPLAFVEPQLEAPVRQWRVAGTLLALRTQVDALAPRRSKRSDGTIGDPAHASRASDHNPWVADGGKGIVTAIDITHDPANGCDAGRIAETLRSNRDPRVKYIIWNRRIANASPVGAAPAWAWRAYTGRNPHNHHCHISVRPEKARFDDASPWRLESVAPEAVTGDAEEEALRDIEVALSALGGVAEDESGATPLLARLLAAQETIDGLLSLYARAVHDGIDTAEATRPTLAQLRPDYERLFADARIRAGSEGVVAFHRTKLRNGRERYEEVAAETGIPWWFIGIVHALEASFNFAGHLHNGDPLTGRTVNVPRGRPERWLPPSDWKTSALDALRFQGFVGEQDWSVPACLYRFEAYNGFGYRRHGINSPYLWSFSQHYSAGKFVRDGVFDRNAVSKQCGAATMLKSLQLSGDIAL